jgi:hypothetical protein
MRLREPGRETGLFIIGSVVTDGDAVADVALGRYYCCTETSDKYNDLDNVY